LHDDPAIGSKNGVSMAVGCYAYGWRSERFGIESVGSPTPEQVLRHSLDRAHKQQRAE
tara:strand:+ start:9580 stop:9753 length:174 start_codon:yes stop_codon:yes gene_type:complete